MNDTSHALDSGPGTSHGVRPAAPPKAGPSEAQLARAWRVHLLVFAPLLLATLALLGSSYWAMVTTWARSETFAHGFIVVPMSIYLIWRKRGLLRKHAPSASPFALVILAALGFAWLLGHAADVLGVQELAVTLVIPTLVCLVFGWHIARLLAFPLAFLLLAVPIGEFLVPTLVHFTASFTVHALQWTGVPVYWEGNRFSLPSGDWSVVKACSGVRYLYATLTVALLYVYLNYRSRWRQILFVVIAIAFSILANGVRAYAIVMIAHLSQMRLAVGIDHFIYGWVFFALMILLLFWIGGLMRERDSEPSTVIRTRSTHPVGSARRALIAGVAGAVIVAAFPAWALHVESTSIDSSAVRLTAPEVANGWEAWHGATIADWEPIYVNPTATLSEQFSKGDDRVGLYVAYYAAQHQGSELINFQNVLAKEKAPWHVVGGDTALVNINGKERKIKERRLRSNSGELLVWQWYWVNGNHLDSGYMVKLHEALDMLTAGRRRGAGIVAYTPVKNDLEQARSRLRSFVLGASDALDASLAQADTGAN